MATITSSPPPAAAPAASRLRHWAPLAVVLAGTSISVLDFFIVNVALPAMQHSTACRRQRARVGRRRLRADHRGAADRKRRLGDRFGRRRMFCAGLALFTLASAACGAAPDAATLIAGRLLQGAGGALLRHQRAVADRRDLHQRGRPREGNGRVCDRHGLRRRRRSADRRRAAADRPARPELAQLLPDQPADRAA